MYQGLERLLNKSLPAIAVVSIIWFLRTLFCLFNQQAPECTVQGCFTANPAVTLLHSKVSKPALEEMQGGCHHTDFIVSVTEWKLVLLCLLSVVEYHKSNMPCLFHLLLILYSGNRA